MQFKPKKIKIDPVDPFKEDRLERKADVENLSLLLRQLSTPIVLSINAPWGQGKTTFLEMLQADLKSKECNTVYFSAWETDFASDPLLAFLGEMNDAIETLAGKDPIKVEKWKKAKKAGSHILKRGIPALIKIGTAGIIDAEDLIEEASAGLAEQLSGDLIAEYLNSKNEIKKFKENISSILSNKSEHQTKLYIFVDELDRCRPTYAIELLERIKHLLDIDGLVFILAMDKGQLSHSVKAVYGEKFESIGYLRRFIDIEYSLPQKEIGDFIDSLYNHFEFGIFFEKRKKYTELIYDSSQLLSTFKLLASENSFSPREIEQLFTKINLVIRSTDENIFLHPALLSFLIIAKEFHNGVYKEYIKESSTPESIIKLLYIMFSEDIRDAHNECATIEGLLILAKHGSFHSNIGDSLAKHEKNKSDSACSEKTRSYSNKVSGFVASHFSRGQEVNLKSLISRIEMLENFKF